MGLPRPPPKPVATVPASAPETAATPAFRPVALRRSERGEQRQGPVRPRRMQAAPVVALVLFGGGAFVAGYYASYYGAVPGVFLASQIGLPVAFTFLLRALARQAEDLLSDPLYARGSASVARGASWALGLFWIFSTWTQVIQLAVGLAGGILAYQIYVARGRVKATGREGLGPVFAPTLFVFAVFVLWTLLRSAAGAMDGFDAASFVATAAVSVVALVWGARAARAADARPVPVAPATPVGKAKGEAQHRLIVGLAIGYLIFRFFISPEIPYGPIVEWFLVCIGVLFFAIVAADRIGVVPTRRSLPHPSVRSHVQRVASLPDRRLAETEAMLDAYITRAEGTSAVRAFFAALLADAGVPGTRATPLLDALDATRRARREGGPAERRAVVTALVDAVATAKPRAAIPTGTLKSAAPVRAERTGSLRVPGA